MFKKILLILPVLFLLCTTLIFTSCQREKEPPEKLSLTAISRSPLYAPLFIAESQGFFTNERLAVAINTISSNAELIDALNTRETDIILAGPQNTITQEKTREDRLVNFAQLIQKDPSYLLAREAQPDFQWQDLNKKIVIGAVTNSTPELVLEYLLLKHGLPPFRKVDIIHNIPPETALGAFMGGVGDYIHLLEPQVSYLEKSQKGFIVAAVGDHIGEIAYTNFIALDTFLQAKPQAVQKFVNALYQGQLWCKYHTPAEIYQALLPYFPDLDKEILQRMIVHYKNQDIWTDTPVIKEPAFQKIREILRKSGLSTAEIDFTGIVNNTFAQKTVEEVPIPKEYTKKD
ncbi:MAG: ABC transporter substrate-binding protein [Peptococcaceae bacterium]